MAQIKYTAEPGMFNYKVKVEKVSMFGLRRQEIGTEINSGKVILHSAAVAAASGATCAASAADDALGAPIKTGIAIAFQTLVVAPITLTVSAIGGIFKKTP